MTTVLPDPNTSQDNHTAFISSADSTSFQSPMTNFKPTPDAGGAGGPPICYSFPNNDKNPTRLINNHGHTPSNRSKGSSKNSVSTPETSLSFQTPNQVDSFSDVDYTNDFAAELRSLEQWFDLLSYKEKVLAVDSLINRMAKIPLSNDRSQDSKVTSAMNKLTIHDSHWPINNNCEMPSESRTLSPFRPTHRSQLSEPLLGLNIEDPFNGDDITGTLASTNDQMTTKHALTPSLTTSRIFPVPQQPNTSINSLLLPNRNIFTGYNNNGTLVRADLDSPSTNSFHVKSPILEGWNRPSFDLIQRSRSADPTASRPTWNNILEKNDDINDIGFMSGTEPMSPLYNRQNYRSYLNSDEPLSRVVSQPEYPLNNNNSTGFNLEAGLRSNTKSPTVSSGPYSPFPVDLTTFLSADSANVYTDDNVNGSMPVNSYKLADELNSSASMKMAALSTINSRAMMDSKQGGSTTPTRDVYSMGNRRNNNSGYQVNMNVNVSPHHHRSVSQNSYKMDNNDSSLLRMAFKNNNQSGSNMSSPVLSLPPHPQQNPHYLQSNGMVYNNNNNSPSRLHAHPRSNKQYRHIPAPITPYKQQVHGGPLTGGSMTGMPSSPRTLEPITVELLLDIPSWLRTLRLHKYTENLKDMGWRDLIELDSDQLAEKGVSALGARRKMLKVFETVKERVGNGEFSDI